MDRLKEIEKRLAEIKAELEKDGADIDALEEETKKLIEERKQIKEKIEKRNKIISDITNGAGTPIPGVMPQEERKVDFVNMTKDEIIVTPEYRSAYFKNLQGKELTEVEKRVLAGGTNALPVQTANTIIEKLHDMVPLLNEIDLFRVNGTLNVMIEKTAPDANLEPAGSAVTESNAELMKVTLTGYNINAFLTIGADLETMALSAFEDWIVRKLAEAIAYKIEYYIINGDGNSAPTGIEYYATWDVSDGTAVDWTGGTGGNALAVVDLDNAIGLLPAAYDREARFLMSKKTFYKNVIGLQDENNLPVIQREGNTFLIRGFKVLFSDQVADGDIYFGSFRRGMVGNLGVDIKVERQRNLRYNAYDFLGWAIFDCKPAQSGCIVKIAGDIQA
jgi:HK97 family phage major capsid protein